MKDTLTFLNVKVKDLAKPQVKFVLFNKNLVQEVDKENIRLTERQHIFFIIPRWLADSKEYSSCRLYGRVTDLTPKGIQINFTEWFPISQIKHIFISKEDHQSTLLKFVEEKNENGKNTI